MKVDDTRERILDVAGHFFGKFGYQKTTVDEIARAAHKAKGSVYYYFQSKEDLFRGVLEKEAETCVRELVKSLENGRTSTEKLEIYIVTRMRLVDEAANFYEAMKSEYLTFLGFIESIRAKYDLEEIVRIKTILAAGVANNEFEIEDVELTAHAIVTAMKGLEIPFFFFFLYADHEIRLEELLRILIRGIIKQ